MNAFEKMNEKRKKNNQTRGGERGRTTPKSLSNKYDYCFFQNVEKNDKDKGTRGGIGGNKGLSDPFLLLLSISHFFSESAAQIQPGSQIFHFCACTAVWEEG